MSEVLFRGKRTDSGEWVEGSVVHQTLHYGDPVDRYHIIYDGEFDYDYYSSAIVIPETVGQYTGLTDKNGTKIFEGDAILYDDEVGCIIYDGEDANFCLSFGTWATDFGCVDSRDVEVIGNIHDNPELME